MSGAQQCGEGNGTLKQRGGFYIINNKIISEIRNVDKAGKQYKKRIF